MFLSWINLLPVFFITPPGICLLIGLGGTRLFRLECPFPSLSVCGLSCYPVIGMSVVLKFDNLQYEGSTCLLACYPDLSSAFVMGRCGCRFYRGMMSLPDVKSRCVRRWVVCRRMFSAMMMGFLISGASEACRMLGLCTYHAFSLLNVC